MPRTGRFPAPNAGLPYLVFRTTPRDRRLAAMLLEHRVLTSDQIAQLAFTTLRRANQRLAELAEIGVVDRSRANPAVYGSCPHSRFGWFFEYDTGTESIHRLARKTHGYHRFAREHTGTYPALIRVPSPAREARLHEVIAETYPGTCPIPLATTSSDGLGAPVWRIAGDQHPSAAVHTALRCRLAALGEMFARFGYRLMEPTDTYEEDKDVPAPTCDPL